MPDMNGKGRECMAKAMLKCVKSKAAIMQTYLSSNLVGDEVSQQVPVNGCKLSLQIWVISCWLNSQCIFQRSPAKYSFLPGCRQTDNCQSGGLDKTVTAVATMIVLRLARSNVGVCSWLKVGAQIVAERQEGSHQKQHVMFRYCSTAEHGTAKLPFLKLCMSCMSRTRRALGATARTLNEYASSV